MNILTKSKSEKKQIADNVKKDSPRLPAPGPAFLLKQVWITEKAVNMSGFGKYIFMVSRKANKSEIKKAIESIYKVKVAGVNVINVAGKSKRLGRSVGKTPAYKKAIVTLKEGHKIDVLPT